MKERRKKGKIEGRKEEWIEEGRPMIWIYSGGNKYIYIYNILTVFLMNG